MSHTPKATGDNSPCSYEVQKYAWGPYSIEVILDNCGRFVDINSISSRKDFYDLNQFIDKTDYFNIEDLYEDDESDNE